MPPQMDPDPGIHRDRFLDPTDGPKKLATVEQTRLSNPSVSVIIAIEFDISYKE